MTPAPKTRVVWRVYTVPSTHPPRLPRNKQRRVRRAPVLVYTGLTFEEARNYYVKLWETAPTERHLMKRYRVRLAS